MFFKQQGTDRGCYRYPDGYTEDVSPATLIHRARIDAGLSQQALAARAGTSQATLSAYERGRKDPSASTLMRILAAAGRRVTTTPASVVVTPSPDTLRERGRILEQVLELAEGLPVHHAPTTRYPPLKDRAQRAAARRG
jgi:transcriptional regulator with XRE-family HTH domain